MLATVFLMAWHKIFMEHFRVVLTMRYPNTPILYFWYWTGTSLQWRPMQGDTIKMKLKKCHFHFKKLLTLASVAT